MKNFIKWAEDKKYDLSFLDETPNKNKRVKAENTKRSGISANYPDAYVRGQYPHKYFNPIAADADYKLEAKPNKKSST